MCLLQEFAYLANVVLVFWLQWIPSFTVSSTDSIQSFRLQSLIQIGTWFITSIEPDIVQMIKECECLLQTVCIKIWQINQNVWLTSEAPPRRRQRVRDLTRSCCRFLLIVSSVVHAQRMNHITWLAWHSVFSWILNELDGTARLCCTCVSESCKASVNWNVWKGVGKLPHSS